MSLKGKSDWVHDSELLSKDAVHPAVALEVVSVKDVMVEVDGLKNDVEEIISFYQFDVKNPFELKKVLLSKIDSRFCFDDGCEVAGRQGGEMKDGCKR